jgi:hypothetical protein
MLAATLALRLPFLRAGFGIDSDAWRVALAARLIRTTGVYGSSRVPGHPVQDILAAALSGLGPVGLNGATAVLSCVAVYFFYRLARRFVVPHPIILSLGFAFLPLVYVQSVNALDYMWAMALLLGAVEAFFAGRLVLAGICLGLATGCRLTSLAMVLPLALISGLTDRGRTLIRTVGTAIALALLCYLPVLWTYGTSYLRFTPTPFPRIAYIAKEMTLDIFGVLGLCGLAMVIAAELMTRLKGPPRRPPSAEWHRLRLFAVLVGLCYVFIFLRLPDDAAYLLPVVPFGLLALATWLSPRSLMLLSIMLVASGFFMKLREVRRVGGPVLSSFSIPLGRSLALELPGPIFADHERRRSEEAFADSTLAAVSNLPHGSALFVADWFPILTFKASNPAIVQYPTEAQIRQLRSRSALILYLPDVQRDVQTKTGIDLVANGGQVLDVGQKKVTDHYRK